MTQTRRDRLTTPLKKYRMTIPAAIWVDIYARTGQEAQDQAEALRWEMMNWDDGVAEVRDIEEGERGFAVLRTGLIAGTVFPVDSGAVRQVDVTDSGAVLDPAQVNRHYREP